MKNAGYRFLSERGQTILETAIVVPVLLMFLATVADVGRYMLLESNVRAAADSVARQAEASWSITKSQAKEYLDVTYPTIADDLEVTLGTVSTEAENVEYKVYDARTSTFKSRPSTVSWQKRPVTVTYTGTWTTPGLVAASGLVEADGKFTIEKTVVATVDTTLDTW